MQFSLAERLLYGLPQIVITLLILVLLAVANFVGHRLRLARDKRSGSNADNSHEGFVVSSVIGFLALLMGFTFSMAVTTFNNRAAMVVQEAISVQSSYLDAQ